ncbi:MAG: UDP-N-acetylglucosamine 1-carboxyvinyltransferase [Eubacteriales bacterium]|nr:UDP-N-acetylglucosamine 1-carboxyvinyltransferase [Eubacteriales bacterium]
MFRVVGGNRLGGEVRVDGAKNAVLPILAASLMASGPVVIEDCPRLMDVTNMLSILKTLGCRVENLENAVRLDAEGAYRWEMPEHLSKSLRSSIFMMGPLLGRFRRAKVTYPGGCEIGLRPIDLHLKGLKALGVSVRESHGMILLDGARMRGGAVYLDFPSVGATENIMMAAAAIRGRTTIHNAARDPEIRDLQNFINAMGGRIAGAGTDKIVIDGVAGLHGVRYTPIPDRIVAGTLLAAVAAAGGEARILRARPEDLGAPLDKLRQTGCEIVEDEHGISIASSGKIIPFEISTQPFPGFPTDLQAQFMALACLAEGTSVIVENLFESRFAHAAQLTRMGADIRVNNRMAVVRGGKLTGARVHASDLRGGAALVVAALAAEGETIVENVALIDRGYERLERVLTALGGDVRRIDQEGGG